MYISIRVALIVATLTLSGCSRSQDGRDGQFVTDADSRRFYPRVPFTGADFRSEAQKLLDDHVTKHRGDGAIQSVQVEAARVDVSSSNVNETDFVFSGQAVVTVTGLAPFEVNFRELVTGSLAPNNDRLLNHWFFHDGPDDAAHSPYVLGLEPWQSRLTGEDACAVGHDIAAVLSITQFIENLRDHPDSSGVESWRKASAVAWKRRAEIIRPLSAL